MPSSLRAKIESILFVANRPLTIKKLAEICGKEKDEIITAIETIVEEWNSDDHGIRLLCVGDEVQMGTSGDNAKLVQEFLKDETTGELTKPSLEALTIIAYRGPISKAELEQIRGVHSGLILRNLLMRGLIEGKGDVSDPQSTYHITMDFLRFLGVSSVEELPDYNTLRSHENILRILESSKPT